MDRRTFIHGCAGGLLAAGRVCDAQQPVNLPIVGVLSPNAGTSVTYRTFVQGLQDLGYFEGRNIVTRVRSAEGKPDVLPILAAELAQAHVNVIYATGPAAIRAARAATMTIPIVALDLETDPVQAGWVSSLARPGSNLTGLFLDLPGLAGKWLELLIAAAPEVRRVGLLWDSTTGSAQLNAAQAAAQGFGIESRVLEVRSSSDIDAALGVAAREGVRAIVMLSSPTLSDHEQRIAEFTLKNRLPAISPFKRFASFGGLMAYGPDLDDMRRRAASYVVRILKGDKPADLAIEQPTKFQMVINLRTAKALGRTVPQSLLVRADDVIR